MQAFSTLSHLSVERVQVAENLSDEEAFEAQVKQKMKSLGAVRFAAHLAVVHKIPIRTRFLYRGHKNAKRTNVNLRFLFLPVFFIKIR